MFSSTCHRWKWDEVFDMLFTRSFKSKLLKHTSIKIWEGQSCSFCCSKSCTVHRPCPEKGIFTVYLWIIQTLRLNFVPGLLCYITSELRYFRETACVVFACSSSVHTEFACLVSIVIFRDVCKQLIGTDKGNVVCMWHDVWKRWWVVEVYFCWLHSDTNQCSSLTSTRIISNLASGPDFKLTYKLVNAQITFWMPHRVTFCSAANKWFKGSENT